MKITKIVTGPARIWHILTKIGWPTTLPDFDEPQDLVEWEICQLIPGTADGFPEEYDLPYSSGSDPPECHFDDNIDSPHWEDSFRAKSDSSILADAIMPRNLAAGSHRIPLDLKMDP